MTAPHIVLLVNPAANTGRAGRRAGPVTDRLRKYATVAAVVTADAEDTRVAAARAVADGADSVVILGGDGSVHQAIQSLARTDVIFGVIPAGTGNDVADLLGLPADPLAAADAVGSAIAERHSRRIDLGRTDPVEGQTGGWWVTVLCAGFDSAVNERANAMRWPRGPRRYDLAIAREAVQLRPYEYCLEIDGVPHDIDATLVSVGNGPQYGGGKRLVPSARLDDGHFTVCVVGPVSRRTLIRLAPALDRGGHVGHPAVAFYPAHRVRITAERIAYADGERLGPLPISTECVPGALRTVAVPPG
jgi:diacylglycerol kinase (ATP)